MKKHILITVAVFIAVCALLVSGYFLLDCAFPKAEDIEYPAVGDVVSLTVSLNSKEKLEIGEEKTKDIISAVACAKPTRIPSVNDYPTANPFYKIEISTKDRVYYYFVYEDGDVFVEMPYVGVYCADVALLELLM